MKRRDMKLLLEERFERIALLETRIDTMDQLVEGYRAREQAIFDTLQAAKESAAKLLEQAQAEGAQVRAEAEAVLADAQDARINARAEAEALLSDAINTANQLKTEAERRGNEVSASIKADSERMLRDAEIIKREYEEMVESFNAMLEQNASELEVTAARFAEFVKNRKIDRSEARLDGNAFYKSVGEMNDANLPDASDDPSRLMQNIYRIQNRPLPEDRTEAAAHETVAQSDFAAEPNPQTDAQTGDTSGRTTEFFEGTANQTQQPAAEEPYSEAAWVNEAGESKTEPQAEFVQAFDGAYTKSDYSVRADCAVTQEDAKSAFDTFASSGEAAQAAGSMIPESSVIVAAGIAAEPLEDAARAFDEYFDETFEPSGKTAQDEIPQEQAEGPEGAAPAVAATQEEAAAPEPYSERAWAQSSFASVYEPQAEGALFGASSYAAEPAQTIAVEQETPAATEPVSAGEVESAFDDYLAQINTFTPVVPIAAAEPAIASVAAPEPYSERAWAQSSFASEFEPQAEGTLFGASSFAAEPPQGTVVEPEAPVFTEPVSADEAEHAFDDYLAQINTFAPVVPIAAAEPAIAALVAPEPYSERAWAQSSFASEFEPQAEGSLFAAASSFAVEPAQVAAVEQETPAATEPVSAGEAEHAFDDYLAQINAFVPAAQIFASEPAVAPEPYSEQAWAQSAAESIHEPQAEGALFVDTYTYEPEPAQPAAAAEPYAHVVTGPVSASEAEHALDDYLTQMYAFSPAKPAVAATKSALAPEPYSKQAWAESATVSEYEPQAEGESHLSAEPEEEEEPEPAPAPRRYNDYGEIREWEPEPEPEMVDMPTVSRYVGKSGSSDEVSLDDLLDEIIKAGE